MPPLLGELAYNDALRARVIAGQRARLADFGDDRIRRELGQLLATHTTKDMHQ